MKKLFIWALCFVAILGGSFAAGRAWDERHRETATGNSDFDNGFRPAAFPLENHSFVIFICGYNNGAFLQKTLRSVFSQAYDNYRLIYIDDASTDGSAEGARDFIYESGHLLRSTFAQNEQRLGQLANLIRAVQTCQDQEILVVLNGEDWLAHEWVLHRLNQYYADPDLWLTYGQCREAPTYRLGSGRYYTKQEWTQLRQAPFAAAHLQTFYASLFRKIDETDFLQQGTFFPHRADLAIMFPMLEMAEDHFQFIPEVLYISNRHAAILSERDCQARCERFIRSLKPYSQITSLEVAPIQDLEETRTSEGA